MIQHHRFRVIHRQTLGPRFLDLRTMKRALGSRIRNGGGLAIPEKEVETLKTEPNPIRPAGGFYLYSRCFSQVTEDGSNLGTSDSRNSSVVSVCAPPHNAPSIKSFETKMIKCSTPQRNESE